MTYLILSLYILGTLIFIYVIKCVSQTFQILYYVQKLPGPPTSSLLFGNYGPLMRATSDELFQMARELGLKYYPLYKLWTPILCIVNIVNPEDMALILSDTKHLKKGVNYETVSKWLKSGLLTSDGEKWLQRRKILTPAFHFKILQDFIETFNEKTVKLVEILKKETEKSHTELNEFIINCTLEIMLETAMSKKVEFESKKGKSYKHALHDLGKLMVYRILRPYLLFKWIFTFTPGFFKELKLVKILHDFTKEIITEKEKNFQSDETTLKKPLALLDLLFTAKKKGAIDDAGIKEEVDTFMFEGHDTISTAISFGLMLIASHPNIQENIVLEMRQVLGNIKKTPDYDDLQKLKYMERCIKEILRIYPPVPFLSRLLTEDHVTHNGYKLKKNTWVGLHIYDLHRSPHIYPDPEKFDPDRFLPENCKNRHPYAYIPFSAGPRNCIGQKFAMLEMKAILCGVLGNFVLQPVDTPETVVFVVDFVLRSKNNIKIKFLSREE